MNTQSIQQINNKLANLPERTFKQIDEFLDFLYFKNTNQEKVGTLSVEQKKELKHIKDAFKQVELLKKGKLKTRPVEDLLNEL